MKVTLIKSSLNGMTDLFTWKHIGVSIYNTFLNKNWQYYIIYTNKYDPVCDFKTRREAIQHLKRTTKYKRIPDITTTGVYGSFVYKDCYKIEIKQ